MINLDLQRHSKILFESPDYTQNGNVEFDKNSLPIYAILWPFLVSSETLIYKRLSVCVINITLCIDKLFVLEILF